MKRETLITTAWVVAGLIALAPAMAFISAGIIVSLTFLPTLPQAVVDPSASTLILICRTIGETIGGCAGLIAAWLGILIPQKVRVRPNLKRIFLVFACAGLVALLGYLPEEGWRHATFTRLWIMLGPAIMGFCGLCRVFCGKSSIGVQAPSETKS